MEHQVKKVWNQKLTVIIKKIEKVINYLGNKTIEIVMN